MVSHSLNELKAGPVSDGGKGRKNGFSNQPGLHERPPAGRKEILKLLESAIENNSDNLKEAMCLFHGLEQKQKEKIMGKMEKKLKKLCGYQFSEEDNARAVRVIADFFAEASECLPKDDEGEKVTDSIKGAAEALMKVAKKKKSSKKKK